MDIKFESNIIAANYGKFGIFRNNFIKNYSQIHINHFSKIQSLS